MISYEQAWKSIRAHLCALPVGARFTISDLRAEYALGQYQIGAHNPNDQQPTNFKLLSAINHILDWYAQKNMERVIPEYPGKKGYEEYIEFVPDPSRKLALIQEYPLYEASDGNSYPSLDNVYQVQAV